MVKPQIIKGCIGCKHYENNWCYKNKCSIQPQKIEIIDNVISISYTDCNEGDYCISIENIYKPINIDIEQDLKERTHKWLNVGFAKKK